MQNNHKDSEVLLKVEHLCQYFGRGDFVTRAVDDVSFDIKKGEVLGLVGESGCGKTTTGRSIIKLYNITSGNVYFKGIRIAAGAKSYRDAITKAKEDYEVYAKEGHTAEEVAAKKAETDAFIAEQKIALKEAINDQKNCDKEYAAECVAKVNAEYNPKLASATGAELAALKKEYKAELHKAKRTRLVTQIQMIFQDPIASLDPRMTAKEIIAEGLRIKGIKDEAYIEEKVYEILELVGLVREHASRYPHEFSGGQKQRIGIARAVIMNPEMIIADEPVSALDVSVQAQVINLLNELREKLGLTILFIAHDLSVVKYFSDRIGVMYFGKLVELADSDELFAHPLHPYTKSLLSAIPLPDPNYEKTRQRITYNPLAEHDYTVDKPSLREVRPGHFVQCNDAEEAKIRAELGL